MKPKRNAWRHLFRGGQKSTVKFALTFGCARPRPQGTTPRELICGRPGCEKKRSARQRFANMKNKRSSVLSSRNARPPRISPENCIVRFSFKKTRSRDRSSNSFGFCCAKNSVLAFGDLFGWFSPFRDRAQRKGLMLSPQLLNGGVFEWIDDSFPHRVDQTECFHLAQRPERSEQSGVSADFGLFGLHGLERI